MTTTETTTTITINARGPIRPYLAQITGPHPKYKLDRDFQRSTSDTLSRSGKTGSVVYDVARGAVYEATDGRDRWYVAVTHDGQVVDLPGPVAALHEVQTPDITAEPAPEPAPVATAATTAATRGLDAHVAALLADTTLTVRQVADAAGITVGRARHSLRRLREAGLAASGRVPGDRAHHWTSTH